MKLEAFNRIIAAITDAYTGSASEIIEYEIHTSKYWIFLFLGIIAVAAVALVVTIWADKKYNLSMSAWPTVIYATCSMTIVVLIVAVFVQAHDIYVAEYFPEKMVIRYVEYAIRNLEL